VFGRKGLSVHMGPGGFRGDRILFSANAGDTRSIYSVRVSTENWKAIGRPQRLTFGTGLEVQPFPGPGSQLAFVSLTFSYNIWCLPIRKPGQPDTEMQQLTRGRGLDANPSCSRDLKKMVFTSGNPGSRDLWLKDLQTGRETALTATPADEISPVISEDGLRVAYSISSIAENPIYMVDLSLPPGSSISERVCDNCGQPLGFSPDGSQILYVSGHPKSIGLLTIALSQKTRLLQHPQYDLDQAQFSPDGAWISVVVYTGPNHTTMYVLRIRNGSTVPQNEWIPITNGNSWDDRPRWSPDGNSIYFYSRCDGYGCIWKLNLDRNTKKPIGPPSAVHHFHNARISLMHMSLSRMGISAAQDKLIFNLVENTGNLWMMQGGGLY